MQALQPLGQNEDFKALSNDISFHWSRLIEFDESVVVSDKHAPNHKLQVYSRV